MKTKIAFIPAAGFGTRMEEYTQEIPKPLLQVAKYPLIVYTLFVLYYFNVDYVVINLHYQKEKIKDFLKDFPYFPIYFSEEEEILGTAGGIAYAIYKNLIKDFFLVINPDTFFFPNFNPFNDIILLESFSIDHLLYIQKKDLKNINEKGFEILNEMKGIYYLKLSTLRDLNQYFYTGISIFHSSFFNYYKNYSIDLSIKDFKKELSQLLKEPIYGKIYNGIRLDCGTKTEYESLNKQFYSALQIIPKNLHHSWINFIKGWKLCF
jgi:MurNAc alpha-1-phosphate uridylyltransferase